MDDRTLYSTARSARRQVGYGSAVYVMIVLLQTSTYISGIT